MSNELDRRVEKARLLHAAPNDVFDELRAAAARDEHLWSSEIEAALLTRDDPQINLALAAYGENSDVIRTLYESSVSQASSPLTDRHNAELRHACLSNSRAVIFSRHVGLAGVIGEPESGRLLLTGDNEDAAALISNATVGDAILVSLYNRTGIFEAATHDRWRALIGWSSHNPRLAIDRDSRDGPDLGAWQIQEGIQHLLSTAPATEDWAFELILVLEAIDPHNYLKPVATSGILARWIVVKADKWKEGLRTSLTMAQELCCLISALYGAAPADGGSSPDDDWSARFRRCAHYGKDTLSKDDLENGFAKDGDAFAISVLCNDAVFRNNELREYLEERCLHGRGIWERYEQRCRQLQRRWPWVRPSTPDETHEQSQPHGAASQELAAAISELAKSLTGRLESFKFWVIVGFVVLAVILLLHW